MSDNFGGARLDALPARAAQYSIVFVQIGAQYASVRESIGVLEGVHVSGREFIGLHALVESGSGPVFVSEVEAFAENRGASLGALRERVMHAVATGRPVVLLSRIPKTAYPETTGSDVVADAKQLFFLHDSVLLEDVESLSVDGFLPYLRDLGDRTLGALAEVLWEFQMSPNEALSALTKPDVEALRGAGFLVISGETLAWTIGKNFKKFRHGVALVSSEIVNANPSVPDTFTDLWTLERILRNVIRRGLVQKAGDGWRDTCVPSGLADEVVERARKDNQPAANSMRDIRDPLEWLTTSELFDVRDQRQLGPMGLEPYLWTKMRVEVLPIRNKIAHMRVVTEEDARRVATWRRVAASRLT